MDSTDKKYPGDRAIAAFRLCAAVIDQMETLAPAAKGILKAFEPVIDESEQKSTGRRAAIKAQKERKNNA